MPQAIGKILKKDQVFMLVTCIAQTEIVLQLSAYLNWKSFKVIQSLFTINFCKNKRWNPGIP